MSEHVDLDAADEVADDTDDSAETIDTLRAQVDLLQDENRRLRDRYVRARQTQYRRTAAGLAIVGVAALGGAAVLPPVRDVFIVLGGIGIFSGLLTWYLTPERFVAADVGDDIYKALAQNEAAIVAELGLTQQQYYIPAGDTTATPRLYIPQSDPDTLPPEWYPSDAFVIDDGTVPDGLALTPSGARLYRTFEQASDTSTSPQGVARVRQVEEAIVEMFELARGTELDVVADDGRATLTVTEPAIGAADSFDTPIASFFAVGVGEVLATPVELADVSRVTDANRITVTIRWDPTLTTLGDTADNRSASEERT